MSKLDGMYNRRADISYTVCLNNSHRFEYADGDFSRYFMSIKKFLSDSNLLDQLNATNEIFSFVGCFIL